MEELGKIYYGYEHSFGPEIPSYTFSHGFSPPRIFRLGGKDKNVRYPGRFDPNRPEANRPPMMDGPPGEMGRGQPMYRVKGDSLFLLQH